MDELIEATHELSSDLTSSWFLTENGDIQIDLEDGEFVTLRPEDISTMSAALAQWISSW